MPVRIYDRAMTKTERHRSRRTHDPTLGRTIKAAAIWTLPITPGASGSFNPISPNVKVFGAIYSAESCSDDPARNLIVVPNRGVGPNVQVNDAWVSLL